MRRRAGVLALGVVLIADAGGMAHAQTLPRIASVPQPAAPTGRTVGSAPLGAPNPAGLTSRFPAGLPSPESGTATSSAPVAVSPVSSRRVVVVPAPLVTGAEPAAEGVALGTNVMGAVGAGGVSSPRFAPGAGVMGPYAAVDVARSFIEADRNRDGELTRAEAQRLAIMPYSFDEMDLNHDGIVTRFEYEDATR